MDHDPQQRFYQRVDTFAEGIKQSIHWYDADERRKIINQETNAMIVRIIVAYEKALHQAS